MLNRLNKLKEEERELLVEIKYIEMMLDDENKLTTKEQEFMDVLGIDLDFESRLQCRIRDIKLIQAEIKLLEGKL